MFRKVSAKLAKMRKPQDFHVQPTSDGRVIVQSTKSIGIFDPKTGLGRLCLTGCYFPHLTIAKPYQFPPEFVADCLHACPSLGGETAIAGGAVIIQHTVTIINEA